ncbi:hypothetical protein DSECCO2_400270 [anaerobic digester metagenome]
MFYSEEKFNWNSALIKKTREGGGEMESRYLYSSGAESVCCPMHGVREGELKILEWDQRIFMSRRKSGV